MCLNLWNPLIHWSYLWWVVKNMVGSLAGVKFRNLLNLFLSSTVAQVFRQKHEQHISCTENGGSFRVRMSSCKRTWRHFVKEMHFSYFFAKAKTSLVHKSWKFWKSKTKQRMVFSLYYDHPCKGFPTTKEAKSSPCTSWVKMGSHVEKTADLWWWMMWCLYFFVQHD